jgi:Outer membrane protein beta-barrel domain
MLRIARALLVFAAILAAPAPAFSQGPGSKFAALVGGLVHSDLGSFVNTGGRWGGTAGILVGVNASWTSITAEGNWIQKGDESTHLDYIEMPVTVGAVMLLRDDKTRARLYTGLSLGFNTSCESDVLDCDQAETTELGWPLGVQFATVRGTNTFIGVDLRYSYPLIEVYDDLDAHNRPWQFRLMFGKAFGASSR